jgi:hypothetical protein
LFFSADDNTVPNCTNCTQSLHWSGWGFGQLIYQYYDRGDNEPSFQNFFTIIPGYPVVIASRVVPEPSGWLAGISGTAILIARLRRKRFRSANSVTF